MDLSNDQKKALVTLEEWFSDAKKEQYITLGGYAGTGKTTLLAILRQSLNKKNKKLRVAFASYTGKAARILRGKLVEQKALMKQDTVGTIHSLIYSPIVNDKEEIIGWKTREVLECDLIIIDEASMVDASIWRDLRIYGKPIIAAGDHGQLPPIKGFFNLMEKPVLRLEEIHRQARENPIIKLSILARERGIIPAITFGENIKKVRRDTVDTQEQVEEWLASYDANTLVLCGYNNTRVRLNCYLRQALEFRSAEPEANDRVICLRNNHEKEVFNGMLGVIMNISPKDDDWYKAEIMMDGEEDVYEGLIYRKQFSSKEAINFTNNRYLTKIGDLFDFGYALTVHKAQGSQAKRVILFEERFSKMTDDEWRRWLYTGVTRAEEELLIVG
ncbi:MAG: ATP-dependent DNA helicase [Patescibacteria group bacterium]|jgi:exodeoxyribonuclease-5